MGVRDCSATTKYIYYIYITNNFIPILYTTNIFIYIDTSTSTTSTPQAPQAPQASTSTSKHKHTSITSTTSMTSEVDRELSIRVLRLCAQRQRQGLQDERKLPLQTLRPQKRRSFSPVEVCGIVLRREDAVFRPISIAHNNTCYASHKKRKRASTTEVLGGSRELPTSLGSVQ